MKFDFDVVDKIVEKYGSRKALVALVGMWLITQITIPETELWLKGVQIAGIVILGVAGVVCQWNLDNENGSKNERKEDG